MKISQYFLSLCVVATMACGQRPAENTDVRQPAVKDAPDPKVLAKKISIFLLGRLPDSQPEAPAVSVDDVLSDRAAAETFARIMFHRTYTLDSRLVSKNFFLSRTEPDAQGRWAYHLAKTPAGATWAACDPGDAIEVNPWWEMQSVVRVCPNSYRPKQFTYLPKHLGTKTAAELESHCGSIEYATGSSFVAGEAGLCGCGPNLIRCVRDMEHWTEVMDSLRREVSDTIHHHMKHNIPIRDLLAGNETFRDRNAEFTYRRWIVEAGGTADFKGLVTWPEEGKWAPRPQLVEGQHSGLLTSHKILYFEGDHRQRLSTFYELLWCSKPTGAAATPEEVLRVVKAHKNVRYEGWKELAARPICTTCHARMDYGRQFFLGYGVYRNPFVFIPKDQPKGIGELYGDDISDRRGEAPLQPNQFGLFVGNQPEFRGCLARKFATHLLGSDATSEAVALFDASLERDGTFRDLYRKAIEILAASEARPLPSYQLTGGRADVPKDHGPLHVAGLLSTAVEEHCLDCHDEIEPELGRPNWERSVALKALANVAFRKMPPPMSSVLSTEAREEIVGRIIQGLWQGEKERALAQNFFMTEIRPVEVHDLATAFHILHQQIDGYASRQPARVPASDPPGPEAKDHEPGVVDSWQPPMWKSTEISLPIGAHTLTPSYAAHIGIEAVIACKAKAPGEKLSDCVDATLSFEKIER